MNNLYEEVVDRLGINGWASIDGFLSPNEVKALLIRFVQLEKEGVFFKAGIGKQQFHTVDKTIRGDLIHWIEDTSNDEPEQRVAQRIEDLMAYLNRTCFLGLRDFEMHMAHYPPGTYYKRHSDRFVQNPHRILSVVMYLNNGWQPSDGGELVILEESGTEHTLAPIAGRMVIFRSELEHEVLPTQVDRYSLTGWMLDQEVGLTFL